MHDPKRCKQLIKKKEDYCMNYDSDFITSLIGPPESSCAAMDAFVAGLDLLPYLEAEPAKHFNWPGHPTTILKIRAGGWRTSPLKGGESGPLVVPDPAEHYDIHFEVQVFQWKKRIALYLHYETRPYYSQAKLKARIDTGSLAQYYQRREEFLRELIALGQVAGFPLSSGIVQIGKAEYDFSGRLQHEVADWVQPVIDEVACRVNEALFNVDRRRRLATTSEDTIDPDTSLELIA
jgi:hypothetical protein